MIMQSAYNAVIEYIKSNVDDRYTFEIIETSDSILGRVEFTECFLDECNGREIEIKRHIIVMTKESVDDEIESWDLEELGALFRFDFPKKFYVKIQ